MDPNEIWETRAYQHWNELIDHYRDPGRNWKNWLFRGQGNSKWGLQSSLERAALDRFHVEPHEMPDVEAGLLRRFKRQIHHFVSVVPSDDDFMEWAALMQHYGAPTRVLDWTYSFFVAVYFALEAARPGDRCAVWALDRDWWWRRAKSALPDDVRDLLHNDPNAKRPETVRSILLRDEPLPLVFPLNPFRLNERLVVQQGVFLVPGDIRRGFMDNLRELHVDDGPPRLIKLEIECTPEMLRDGLRELYSMNINRATLFPGLEGFSRHLEAMIVMRDMIATDAPGRGGSEGSFSP